MFEQRQLAYPFLLHSNVSPSIPTTPFSNGGPFPVGGGEHPPGPPPATIPSEAQSAQLSAVDPGAIIRCRYRYTYIRLNSGRSFWYYPTFIGRRSMSGYRWNGFMWLYYGVDLRRVRSFTCI
ncbi:transporter [Bacillus spongiae]|uniref:Transporter n=1 Tax=Bacillus spongiae TaxID=2683610 RepID=A0ABU8HB39_9BACI